MSIQNLIKKCGKNNVLKILPSLFIMVDTEKIENNKVLCDTDYFTNPEIKVDSLENYETIHDILQITELFNEIAIDKAMVDSVVMSYLGQNCIRYKNLSEKRYGKSLYLDVHAVRIALTDMQTEQTVSRFFGTGFKLCAGVLFFSFLHKNNFWNFNTNFLRLCF